MKSQCCRNRSSDSYEIKQRYIPTFVHQPIFECANVENKQPRFNQTFCSTALDTEGYNIKTIHHKHQKNKIQQLADIKSNFICSNYSHQRRLEDLYPKTGIRYQSKDKWYDHTKENILSTIRNSHHTETLRQRKILQLASSPVFKDFDYESRKTNPQTNQIIQQKITQKPQKYNLVNDQPKENMKVNKKTQKIDEIKSLYQIRQNQNLNKDSIDKNLGQQITKKDFHKNCIPQNQTSQTKIINQKLRRSHSVSKTKAVSKNPIFTVVRGNKIDNRL